MPRSALGQLITFAIERDEDRRVRKYVWVDVRVGDTVQEIASRRGHPEDARKIARLNRIRSTRAVLRHRPKRARDRLRIRVPGTLRTNDRFHVLAADEAPRIVDGYAKFEVVDRPERTGLTVFTGYNPVVMEVPIRFEAFLSPEEADQVERDIALLERMAGRGEFAGAARGEPAVIRISTTNARGQVVPLVPRNYQWTTGNPHAPVWRVTNIDWDTNPLRARGGSRVRQGAVVTVQQHTNVTVVSRSAAERNRQKRRKR